MSVIINILLALIPIFVAVDPLGALPIFLSLTNNLNAKEKRKIIFQSMLTAICLSIGFIYLGQLIFKALGITLGDFTIAGGIILFVIAISDLINLGQEDRKTSSDLGIVPLGTPLIVGPAVLTTSLVMVDTYKQLAVIIAIIVNIIITGVLFLFSDKVFTKIGEAGTKAFSKITNLLLSAIAVMMIRKGIMIILSQLGFLM